MIRFFTVVALVVVPLLGNAQQPAGTLNVKTDGTATGNGVTDDAVAIQSILDTAQSQNKDLYFPPGTYVIGADITTRQGVNLYGDRTGLSIVRSLPGSVYSIGNQTWSDPNSNIEVEDLHFLNSHLDWYGSEAYRKNLKVRRCLFFANDPAFSTTTSHSQFQIALGHAVDGVVEDCVFLRPSNSVGESVSGYKNVRQIYRHSIWGLHLDRAQWLQTQWSRYSEWTDLLGKLQTLRTQFGLTADQGYFRRAIKINGCDKSLLEYNIFNGSPYTPSTPVNRDHVVYAHGGYTDLEVLSNWMRGWPSAPNGGLKIRNTVGTSTVIANYFVNTPLLQYAYDNNNPQAYENAIIHRNHFEIYQNLSDTRLGISFWETVDGIPPQTNNEYSSNVFECPKAYANAINLTNGDLTGHTAYLSNVFLSDGTPASTGGSLALVSGVPNSARTAPYGAYQVPILDIPLFTTAPSFTTNVISLGDVAVDQALAGTLAGMASDADGESMEFMKMNGPDWLQINWDGTYTGTPPGGAVGLNEFTVRVADNHDGYGVATLVVNVPGDGMATTFIPLHDTHVFQSDPAANYGSNTKLALRSDTYNTAFNGFLMFDVDVGAFYVVSATLKLYCSHNAINLTLHEVSDTSWTEGTMTWSNQPALGSTIATQPVGVDTWEVFDVSHMIDAGGRVCFGLTSDEASYSNVDTKEGTHPPVLELVLAVDADDWDNDGMSNDWEVDHFGGETNATASVDSDGDGFDNLGEYISGSDPTNGASFFSATGFQDPFGFVVTWNAVTGRAYGVSYCEAVGVTAFTNLQNGLLYPQDGFTDTTHNAESSGFYSVDVQMAP